MKFKGMVTITGIGPCPPIQRGKGRVVTMTVTHFNGYVWEIDVAGADKAGNVTRETLCPTDVHKLFSATRNDWVMAKDLRVGEALRTQSGFATITSAKPKGGIHRVYNFEVEKTHQYFVGQSRTLSHNVECVVTDSGMWAKSEFNGRTVYQRNDIFETSMKSSWKDPATGQIKTGTNVERMRDGLAPIGKDGLPVNLHHLTQTEPGALAEVTSTLHQKVPHKQLEKGCSFRNDPAKVDQFNEFRSAYWRSR